MDGFTLAFSEITLVLFTTLAPSGAVAYLIMGLPVLTGQARGEAARAPEQVSCLPLVVAMVGLIASATHLGTRPTRCTCSRAWAAARFPPRCSAP